MKLVGFVVLGIVASGLVYGLILYWILRTYPGMGCGSLWIPFLILMPFSLLVGGIVTGFLSCPTLSSKWELFFMAPGLYVPIIFCGLFLTSVFGLLFWPFYYLVSLAGVGLGYLLRAGIRRRVFGVRD
ncbi:MAG: hypothetical protein JSW23_05140 [Planctomycetota bacterium]|nr:MAG: hypothetical protein JSW23_05140 [Planctomycetota bacterium]